MAGPASLFREIHRVRRFADDLQEQLDRVPRQRKAYQAKLQRQEQALKEEQEAIRKLKVTAADKEKQLKGKGESIARYEQQKNLATSKREYDALVVEIAHNKEACGKLEEEALAAMEEGDQRAAKIPGLEKAVADVRAEIDRFEKESAARQGALQSQLGQAQTQLKQLEAQIDPDLRPQYDRTIASMGADGMSLVQGRTCTACNTEIIRAVEMTLQLDGFAVCRSCGRILYPEAAKAVPEEEEA